MWFRNLRAYRFPSRLGIEPDEFERRLKSRLFTPCLPSQEKSLGWVPALNDDASSLVHVASHYWMIRLKCEARLLPPSVVREEVNVRCVKMSKNERRRITQRERRVITDDVRQDLLPRAFTRSSTIRLIVAERAGWIWLDSGSISRSEEALNHLREVLGHMPVAIPELQQSPAHVMAQWLLRDKIPNELTLASEADLIDQREEGSSVRIRGIPLNCNEVVAHIDSGHQVSRLAVEWRNNLKVVIDRDLSLRRIKFDDEIREIHTDLEDDSLARADADFLMMCEVLESFYVRLVSEFGGLNE